MASVEERMAVLEEEFRRLSEKVSKIEKGNFEGIRLKVAGITISDSEGTLRVMLTLDKDGEPFLFFCDKSEKPRVSIGINELSLRESGNKSSIQLVIGEDGPRVSLVDQNDNPRASMGFILGGACILLYDEAHFRIHLGIMNEGRASIILNDAEEKPRIGIAIGEDGSGSLQIVDREGHVVRGVGEE